MHNSRIFSFRFGDKSVTLLPGYIFITHIRSGFMYDVDSIARRGNTLNYRVVTCHGDNIYSFDMGVLIRERRN